ncbi:MAG TPA: response regulator transcription factor [Pyrinomonadaceae bacterium]|nr:response regulator transcription factor [Pyrinomonadaceae bacterium]
MKRILIIEEQEILRGGVKHVFGGADTVIFGEASTVPEALKLVRDHDWDIILLALSLGKRSGLDVLKKLKQLRPHLPVLMFSRHSAEQFARRSLAAGASGYITKDSPRTELITAVNKILAGGKYLSPSVAEKLIFNEDIGAGGAAHDALSAREFDVFRLIALGKTAREIADILSLSTSTISTYRGRILQKLGMKSTAELIHYAFQHKLVD